MTGPLYLAWRYLAYHRFKTAILVSSVTLIVYLPLGLDVLVDQSAAQLTARAADTPLILGARDSPLELVLSSLYFESTPPETLPYGEVARLAEMELAQVIPLYVRFRVREHPIVGTVLEYFELRGLEFAAGRAMAVLGECVLGAAVAESLGVVPGDTVVSSPESVFDLAGVYPLKMRVAGVLEPSNTPDDRAVFVDLKTAWIIEGFGHGHQDLAAPESASAVLSRDGNAVRANASVVQYHEITAGNIDSFHFHGDLSEYPITAIVALPKSEKAGVLLMGRYQVSEEGSAGQHQQIVHPSAVMDDLLATILTVRSFVVAAVLVVASATAGTAVLVFLLSLRLRRREIETIAKIGGSRDSVALVLLCEVVVVLLAAALLAGGLTLATSRFGSEAIRTFIL